MERPLLSIDNALENEIIRIFYPQPFRRQGKIFLHGLIGMIDIDFENEINHSIDRNEIGLNTCYMYSTNFRILTDPACFSSYEDPEMDEFAKKVHKFLFTFPGNRHELREAINSGSIVGKPVWQFGGFRWRWNLYLKWIEKQIDSAQN